MTEVGDARLPPPLSFLMLSILSLSLFLDTLYVCYCLGDATITVSHATNTFQEDIQTQQQREQERTPEQGQPEKRPNPSPPKQPYWTPGALQKLAKGALVWYKFRDYPIWPAQVGTRPFGERASFPLKGAFPFVPAEA